MKSILFIHQSAELYGSDKTILMFISQMDKTKYFPVVILPFEGPLKVEFEKNGIKVVIAPVLKLYRKMFTPGNLTKFAGEYKKGMDMLDALHREHNFSLVYSHTLAALIGFMWASKRKIRHLWHVQEIIARPALFNRGFKFLLSRKANDKVIYDSRETMNFWADGEPAIAKKSDFIWNGLDPAEKPIHTAEEIASVRREFFNADDQPVIGLVGRINSWKGQPLLLRAFARIASDYPDAKLVYLGSAPPNQDFFVDDLKSNIQKLGLTERVTIIPFRQDIWKFWDALDIAVVPSTEPEPFGMVAIEAMLAGKPVVAANHGGLTEIVLDGQTGFLFEPGNDDALASALRKLLDDPQMRTRFGQAGKERASTVFSLRNHVEQFEAVFEEITAGGR